MAVQDLTPQLRTRMGRLERLVGVFVLFATALLVAGLSYYIYTTAQRKGWFLRKVPYHTFVRNAAGLKVGDPVKLMGFEVGQITKIEAMPPAETFLNVYVQFQVREPYYGYIWSDSDARVATGDLLGNRILEVTKGISGKATVLEEEGRIKGLLDASVKTNANHVPLYDLRYSPMTDDSKGFWLSSDESAALTERLEELATMAEQALPNILALTNQLQLALSNVANITRHADELLVAAMPAVTNLTGITATLNGPPGSLGEWLIPTNISRQLTQTLASADSTLVTAQTEVATLTSNLVVSLQNVANLTSNLNAQVQGNGFILSQVSDLIVHADEMMQGLKRHWLLKGAFSADPAPALKSTLEPAVKGAR